MPFSLNHLNLCVSDVEVAQAFFTRHFDFVCTTRHKDAIAVLEGADGFVLVLSRDAAPVYPDWFHVGFLVGSRDEVDVRFAALSAAGVELGRPPHTMRGTYGFYFRALDEVLFEVSVQP
jgi:catechol 2,3-dioxygenase-like lactoylglutathione lyase family enzyme